jgi:hypothetical protein
LRKVYPAARRGIGQARDAGEVSDVDGVPFWVEAKHRKRPNIRAAFAQAVAARGKRTLPVLVITRADRDDDLATMRLDVLVKLLAELEGLRTAFDRALE